jgi:rfaE bifunctional protein nucleotidyltransferase chain/domain
MPARLKDPKVMSLAEAVKARSKLARAGRRLVLTNGVFDLLHPGHTSYLAAARRLAGRNGRLYVALNADRSVRALKGRSRPVLSEADRAYNLAQLRAVDGVVIFRSKRLTREIAALKPDIYCKAGDYTPATLDPGELRALKEAGARIRFLPFLPGFSTTKLIARIRAAGSL